VTLCESADEALARQAQSRHELVLVGWTDSLDAVAFCRRLRELPDGDLSVVALSTQPRMPIDLERAIEAGARQFLLKPHDRALLGLRLTLAERLAADLSLRERVEEARRVAEGRFRALVTHALDIIAILDASGHISYISPAVERVLDVDPQRLIGRSVFELAHPEDLHAVRHAFTEATSRAVPGRVAARFRHRDGGWRHLECIAHRPEDPAVDGVVVNTRDVTERVQLEQQLARRAFYDTLTDLPNRALFMDRLERALAERARNTQGVALLFIDLDGFKTVNDNFGHEVGDRALMAVARRLETCMRHGDTAARLGGDEFTSLLIDIAWPDDAEQIAARIIAELRQPLVIDGASLWLTVSVGVAAATAEVDPRELVHRADAAMYAAKARGKDRYLLWEPALEEPTSDHENV
jgi:diguanylate cyclase (GGDEF)-like protein/PAS domain S-box-containing protein